MSYLPPMANLTKAGGARTGAGRPHKYDEPADTFSFFGPERLIEIVDAEATRKELTRSEMMVEVLTEWAKALRPHHD